MKKQASQSAARLIPCAHAIGPAPWHCCLEFTTHVGSRTLTRALICRDPTPKTRPCQVLLWYWPSFRDHRRHHHRRRRSHPLLLSSALFFPSARKGNIPLASFVGSRRQRRLRRRRANSLRRLRVGAPRDRRMRKRPFKKKKLKKETGNHVFGRGTSKPTHYAHARSHCNLAVTAPLTFNELIILLKINRHPPVRLSVWTHARCKQPRLVSQLID